MTPPSSMASKASPRHRSQRTGLIEQDTRNRTALIVLDMISCWQFPDAEKLVKQAASVAPSIARLRARCRHAGIPVIYANDNSGQWRSDFKHVVQESLESRGPGSEITRCLGPGPEDYFVLKPKHSAFFATPLELLLDHLGTKRLIVTGVAADQCVLGTAADARMRDFEVVVPSDCIASLTLARTRSALAHLRVAMGVGTPASRALKLQASRRSCQ